LRLPEVFCQALTSKAISYIAQNRLEEGRILLEGALERALANDLHTAANRTANNLAVNHESADRYREAADVTAQGLELARRVGDRLSEENFVYGPISCLVLLGEWEEVLARAARADETALQFRALLLPVVIVECARGDLDKARDRLDTDVTLRESEDLQVQLGYAFAEAHVLRQEGRPREALAAADSALGLGLELGITFIGVKLCLVEVLEAAYAAGDRAEVERRLEMIEGLRPGERPPLLEAQAHRFRSKLNGDEAGFRAAAALFRELETPFWLAVTLVEHGEATGSAPLVDEAREIFARLEATPWLTRCDALAPARAETASV
jgi:tetratricopeptide (TPR) repeat protein